MKINFTDDECAEITDALRAVRSLLAAKGLSTKKIEALIVKLLDHRNEARSSASMPKLPPDKAKP